MLKGYSRNLVKYCFVYVQKLIPILHNSCYCEINWAVYSNLLYFFYYYMLLYLTIQHTWPWWHKRYRKCMNEHIFIDKLSSILIQRFFFFSCRMIFCIASIYQLCWSTSEWDLKHLKTHSNEATCLKTSTDKLSFMIQRAFDSHSFQASEVLKRKCTNKSTISNARQSTTKQLTSLCIWSSSLVDMKENLLLEKKNNSYALSLRF